MSRQKASTTVNCFGLLLMATYCHLSVSPIMKSGMMSFFCSYFILAAVMCFLDYCIRTSSGTLRMSVMNKRHAVCLTIQNGPNWNAEKAAQANQLRNVVHG